MATFNPKVITAKELFAMKPGPEGTGMLNLGGLTGDMGAGHLEPTGGGIGVVDVPGLFQWTASMRTEYIKQEVPRLTLREYNVVGNAVQQQAMYMMGFGLQAAAGAAGGAAIGGLIGGGAGAIAGGAIDVEKTGFIYDFPFIEENFRTLTTQWAAATMSTSKIMGQRVSGLKEGMKALGTDLSQLADVPNAFVEEPQQYNHSQMGDPFQFRFYLSNTGHHDDVVRNWHLSYLLMYQNLPNRTSKVLIKPPVIYEVDLPGVMYHPFVYMNSVNVNYKGAQRRMKIDVATITEGNSLDARGPGHRSTRAITEKGTINTTIPDAYEIVITMTPLVKETQNFMQQMASDNTTVFEATVRD